MQKMTLAKGEGNEGTTRGERCACELHVQEFTAQRLEEGGK